MSPQEIIEKLHELSSPKLKAFAEKLTTTKYPILGVSNPDMRVLAKQLVKNGDDVAFIQQEPKTYEEVMVRGFCIALHKTDIENLLEEVDSHIPYIDNWATNDSFVSSLKQFSKNFSLVVAHYESFKTVGSEFERRFFGDVLMSYGLTDDYVDYTLGMLQTIRSGEYYVDMMIAWALATALAKYYDKTLPLIEEHKFSISIHNKAIQKAIESFRVSQEHKDYLRTLKIKVK